MKRINGKMVLVFIVVKIYLFGLIIFSQNEMQ